MSRRQIKVTEIKSTPFQKILLVVVVLTIVQFFYVFAHYHDNYIESEKVFFWTLVYFLPAYAMAALFLSSRVRKMLFPSFERNKMQSSLINHIRSWLVSFAIIVLVPVFFTYSFIILTNDWFGSGTQQWINAKIENVEFKKRRRGNSAWTITIDYQGESRKLTTHSDRSYGDSIALRMYTGGCWGILYTD